MEKGSKHELGIGPEWENPEIFNIYEEGRVLFRDATRAVVQGAFRDNVSREGVVAEIGSGIGELSKLVPEEYKNNLVAMERQEKFSRIHKKASPEAKAIVGDVNELPMRDSSVDSVVSFSVFDTLPDLERAIAEVKRVLKAGGKFVHLLDLQPNMHILMKELPADMIPFPNLVNDVINGFQLVKKVEYEKIRNSIDPRKLPLFDLYVKDPMYCLAYLEQNRQGLARDVALTVQSWSGIDKTATPTLKESFEERMIEALTKNGLTVVSAGDTSAEEIIPKGEAHAKYPEKNYFENNVGSVYKRYRPELDKELPQGYVKVKSVLHLIVAEKSE